MPKQEKNKAQENKPEDKAEEKADPEQKQQKYLQFQLLQQQLEHLSQQLDTLNENLNELTISQDALRQLKETKLSTEILAAIAPGIFIKTLLKDNQKLIVNVGSQTTVEKDLPQVIELLEAQKKELKKTIAQQDALLQALAEQALEIYQEFEQEEKP